MSTPTHRQEVEAELATLNVQELSEFFVIAGGVLMAATTTPQNAPLCVFYKPDTQEIAFYAKGQMAEWWQGKFKEVMRQVGGIQQEIK